MNVTKHKLPSKEKALAFTELKLNQGYANIRIITSQSKLAKRYGIEGEWVLVRSW
jgi:hypothetical protein